MIDCPNGDIRDLLPDLLHDRLGAAERVRVEQHVAACDACTAELSLLRALRSTLRRAPSIDTAAIAASIPAYRAPMQQRSWGGWRAAAAITAIAVGGTSIAVARGWAPSVGPTVASTRPETAAVAMVQPSISSGSAGRAAPAATPIVKPSAPAAASESPAAEPVSLAMTGGAIGDLSDGELATLVSEIESLDALPSEDVISTGVVSGLATPEQTR
jgi:anti-sigma factor RsiW